MKSVLKDASARTDVLNRLRRAEGQLRGIQCMVDRGDDCMKIAQQFSAVRKALDSTYLRMTLCFLQQELIEHMHGDAARRSDMDKTLKNLESLLARMR